MGEDASDDAATRQNIIDQFTLLPSAEKMPLAQDLTAFARTGNFPAEDKNKTIIWKALFTVLGVLAAIFAVGAVALFILGKPTEGAVLITPVTAIIGGLLGLFAPTPQKDGG